MCGERERERERDELAILALAEREREREREKACVTCMREKVCLFVCVICDVCVCVV